MMKNMPNASPNLETFLSEFEKSKSLSFHVSLLQRRINFIKKPNAQKLKTFQEEHLQPDSETKSNNPFGPIEKYKEELETQFKLVQSSLNDIINEFNSKFSQMEELITNEQKSSQLLSLKQDIEEKIAQMKDISTEWLKISIDELLKLQPDDMTISAKKKDKNEPDLFTNKKTEVLSFAKKLEAQAPEIKGLMIMHLKGFQEKSSKTSLDEKVGHLEELFMALETSNLLILTTDLINLLSQIKDSMLEDLRNFKEDYPKIITKEEKATMTKGIKSKYKQKLQQLENIAIKSEQGRNTATVLPQVSQNLSERNILEFKDRTSSIMETFSSIVISFSKRADDLMYITNIKKSLLEIINTEQENLKEEFLHPLLQAIGKNFADINWDENDPKCIRNYHGYRNRFKEKNNTLNDKGVKIDFETLAHLDELEKPVLKNLLEKNNYRKFMECLSNLADRLDFILSKEFYDLNASQKDITLVVKAAAFSHDRCCLSRLLGFLQELDKHWFRSLYFEKQEDRYSLGYFFVEIGENAKEVSEFIRTDVKGRLNFKSLFKHLGDYRQKIKNDPQIVSEVSLICLLNMKTRLQKANSDLKSILKYLQNKMEKLNFVVENYDKIGEPEDEKKLKFSEDISDKIQQTAEFLSSPTISLFQKLTDEIKKLTEELKELQNEKERLEKKCEGPEQHLSDSSDRGSQEFLDYCHKFKGLLYLFLEKFEKHSETKLSDFKDTINVLIINEKDLKLKKSLQKLHRLLSDNNSYLEKLYTHRNASLSVFSNLLALKMTKARMEYLVKTINGKQPKLVKLKLEEPIKPHSQTLEGKAMKDFSELSVHEKFLVIIKEIDNMMFFQKSFEERKDVQDQEGLLKFLRAEKMAFGFLGEYYKLLGKKHKAGLSEIIMENSIFSQDFFDIMQIRHKQLMHQLHKCDDKSVQSATKNQAIPHLKELQYMCTYFSNQYDQKNDTLSEIISNDTRIKFDIKSFTQINEVVFYWYMKLIVLNRFLKREEVITEYDKLVKKYEPKYIDRQLLIGVHWQASLAYTSIRDLNKTVECLKKSLEIAEKMKAKNMVCFLQQNIANAYVDMEDFDNAKVYLRKVPTNASEIDIRYVITAQALLAQIERGQEHYDLGRKRLEVVFIKHYDQLVNQNPIVGLQVLFSLAMANLGDKKLEETRDLIKILKDTYDRNEAKLKNELGQTINQAFSKNRLVINSFNIIQSVVNSENNFQKIYYDSLEDQINLKQNPQLQPYIERCLIHSVILGRIKDLNDDVRKLLKERCNKYININAKLEEIKDLISITLSDVTIFYEMTSEFPLKHRLIDSLKKLLTEKLVDTAIHQFLDGKYESAKEQMEKSIMYRWLDQFHIYEMLKHGRLVQDQKMEIDDKSIKAYLKDRLSDTVADKIRNFNRYYPDTLVQEHDRNNENTESYNKLLKKYEKDLLQKEKIQDLTRKGINELKRDSGMAIAHFNDALCEINKFPGSKATDECDLILLLRTWAYNDIDCFEVTIDSFEHGEKFGQPELSELSKSILELAKRIHRKFEIVLSIAERSCELEPSSANEIVVFQQSSYM